MDLSAPRARRLLLVDPCEECLALGQRLVKDGWEVHSAALEGVGMPTATWACSDCRPRMRT